MVSPYTFKKWIRIALSSEINIGHIEVRVDLWTDNECKTLNQNIYPDTDIDELLKFWISSQIIPCHESGSVIVLDDGSRINIPNYTVGLN